MRINFKNTFTTETVLYGAAFLLALSLRMAGLGLKPLDDAEAVWALQAFRFSQGESTLIGAEPLLVVWNAILFFFTGASPFWARLIPALFGSSLVLLAPGLKPSIGKIPALLAAFFIAVDPGFIAGARQAGGLPIALFGCASALFLLSRRQFSWMGLSLALAILGGQNAWLVGLIIGITFLWGKVFAGNEDVESTAEIQPVRLVAWLVGALLVLGSGFFFVPQGISAIGSAIAGFFSSWTVPASVSVSQLLAGVYSGAPVWLVFGLWEMVRGLRRRDSFTSLCARFLFISLLVLFIFPGRATLHASLITLPLIIMSARWFAVFFSRQEVPAVVMVGLSFLNLALILFVYYNLWKIFIGQPGFGENAYLVRWLSAAGGLALILLIALLIAWGWSETLAPKAALSGLLLGLALLQVSAAWSATGLGRRPQAEIWWSSAWIQDVQLVQQTMDDISLWNTGEKDKLEVVVIGVHSPALEWLLRDQTYRVVEKLAAVEQPDLVITRDQDSLGLSAAYTGQDFVWENQPAWRLMMPLEWLEWMVSRDAPQEKIPLVLWARSDLLPGNNSVTGQTAP